MCVPNSSRFIIIIIVVVVVVMSIRKSFFLAVEQIEWRMSWLCIPLWYSVKRMEWVEFSGKKWYDESVITNVIIWNLHYNRIEAIFLSLALNLSDWLSCALCKIGTSTKTKTKLNSKKNIWEVVMVSNDAVDDGNLERHSLE